MQPDSSLPYLQDTANCPYPEPDQSSPRPSTPHTLKFNFRRVRKIAKSDY